MFYVIMQTEYCNSGFNIYILSKVELLVSVLVNAMINVIDLIRLCQKPL